MTDPSTKYEPHCPSCDARAPTGGSRAPNMVTHCFRCGAELYPVTEYPRVVDRPRPALPAFDPRTFSLNALFVSITMIALLLGALINWPLVGVPMAVFAVPAWYRTVQMLAYMRRCGRKYSATEMVLIFLGSMCLAAVIFGLLAGTFLISVAASLGICSMLIQPFSAFGALQILSSLLSGLLGFSATALVGRQLYRECWRVR